MVPVSTAKKLALFFSLYIAQTIPMSFFSTVIPVMMRQEHFSLSTIGLLQLIKLPWILKFIWSPWVDRSSSTLSHYKKWIFFSESIYAILIFLIAFLNFSIHFYLIIGLILVSFVASATQDIATDALAVLSFNRRDKSLVNSMQSMGSFAGTVLGGGVLLLLFKQYGWASILPFLSLFVLLAIFPLYFYKGKGVDRSAMRQKAKRADLFRFFTQKGIGKQILFLLLFYSTLMGILALLKPYLVDLGYEIHEIGFISGVVGASVAFVASFVGGVLLRRFGLYLTRIAFAFMILITCFYFFLISLTIPTTVQLYVGVSLLWGSYGMAMVLVFTSSMLTVRAGCEGTDFTLQTVISHLSGMCMAILGGALADRYGYSGFFLFVTVMAGVSLLYVSRWMREPKGHSLTEFSCKSGAHSEVSGERGNVNVSSFSHK